MKYFVAEEREARRYDRAMARYEEASVQAYVSLAVLNAGQAVIFTIGLAAVMVMCAYGIKEGTKTVGDFVMINAMMIQLYQPLNFMGMVYREIKQAVIDIEKMFAILALEPEIEDKPGAKPLAVKRGAIRFENVSFAYEPERQILKGLSFEVPAGHPVAVVGPSGAGKSTISRLLFRFYEVSGGRISIDGQDIRDVTQKSLRTAIGMVPQDTVLFNDTIRYNIRYGRWEASDAEVEEAARLAQIDDFIRRSPKGYETEVGERGLKLSGGEKQRVAIARTILKAPPILLLDEATSALDSHTEREIQDALERVSQNRTTLVIAHRLSTIVGADEIIVLDQGVIAERGTHHQLLAKGGLYASMWNRQREAEAAREKLAQVDDESPRPTAIRRGRGEAGRTAGERRAGSSRRSSAPTPRSDRCPFSPPSAPSWRRSTARACRSSACSRWRACSCSGCGRRSAGSPPWRRSGASISSAIRERVTPIRDGIVVAPADGRVSRITNAVPPKELELGERPLPRVSIFMSVFDCHVNRSPVTGKIERIVYHHGAFLNADLDKASENNERNCFVIATEQGPHRRGADRRPGRAPHRLLRARRRDRRRRRAHRHDPLRLARRRLSARRRAAAGGRGPDRDRRRDRASPICAPAIRSAPSGWANEFGLTRAAPGRHGRAGHCKPACTRDRADLSPDGV